MCLRAWPELLTRDGASLVSRRSAKVRSGTRKLMNELSDTVYVESFSIARVREIYLCAAQN